MKIKAFHEVGEVKEISPLISQNINWEAKFTSVILH